jgi:hypothetical protein
MVTVLSDPGDGGRIGSDYGKSHNEIDRNPGVLYKCINVTRFIRYDTTKERRIKSP